MERKQLRIPKNLTREFYQTNVKEQNARKKYLRTKKLLETKLNSRNITKGIFPCEKLWKLLKELRYVVPLNDVCTHEKCHRLYETRNNDEEHSPAMKTTYMQHLKDLKNIKKRAKRI